MNKVPMTGRGFSRLEDELRRLKTVDRPEIIRALAAAREMGDLSENAEYHAAKERQAYVEGRILELGDKLSRAEVIDVERLSGDRVTFGATVKLADEDTDKESVYQIVGTDESDIEAGLLSITSPLARALIGKSVGDSVDVTTPNGSRSFEIVELRYR
ncbi:MAG: transcription elongation factor GreA [Proteobacteria bacterium]|nr:transcription elongation factor GreA [Pseudomonadota bacterium]